MNKIISICGLIFCSSFGFSLKAKADPTWSNWATCPAATWAIGFTISKASLSFDGSPNKINGLKLECADLDKSPTSFISANPLDGRGGLNWQNPVFVGAGFVSGITTRLNLRPFLSHFKDGSAIIGDNGEIILSDDRFPGVGDEGGWAECGPGEAVNGLMVASDETLFSAVSVSCSSYQTAIDARIDAEADRIRIDRLGVLHQYIGLEYVSLDTAVKAALINKITFDSMISNLIGASCAMYELGGGLSTQAEFDSAASLYIKTFGHDHWNQNSRNCDMTTKLIETYSGCTDGSQDVICINRSAYLELKSGLKNKISDYTKYRDEANEIGDRSICERIERLSQKALIEVGLDLTDKIAAGALSGTCTGS